MTQVTLSHPILFIKKLFSLLKQHKLIDTVKKFNSNITSTWSNSRDHSSYVDMIFVSSNLFNYTLFANAQPLDTHLIIVLFISS